MPEISLLGWFHTVLGVLALIIGGYSLARFKVIELSTKSGQIYLSLTLVTAATALMIFQRGTFGPAHVLAVFTLLALAGGLIAAKTQLLGRYSRYFQALCFSATFLFHMIPAITDGLMRLPVGNPVVSDFQDPLLRGFYLAFLILYVLGYLLQVRWFVRQSAVAR